MFRNARVGDKVWGCPYGWGRIKALDKDLMYALEVSFDEGESDTYTISGKCNPVDKHPSLFWDEIRIPERPLRIVKKTAIVYVNVYSDEIVPHASQEEAEIGAGNDRITCIELTGTYEIEE